MSVNPELVKLARAMLDKAEKQGFVTADAMKQAQGMPMDPSMQGMPMDPSMMQGMPPAGPPMPPAGPTPAMPPPPPGSMPPPAAAPTATASPSPEGGGMSPDGGQPVVVNLEDLVSLFQQVAGAGGGQGDNEPTTTNVLLGKRLDALEGKIDELGSLLASLTGSPPGGSAVPPGAAGAAPEVPPELLAQLGAGAAPMPPDAMAAGGMPMDPSMMGAPPMPPAGMAPPMPPPGMAVSASDKRASTYSLAKLAAMLKGNIRA